MLWVRTGDEWICVYITDVLVRVFMKFPQSMSRSAFASSILMNVFHEAQYTVVSLA